MRQNSTSSFEDERSEVGENVTNLVQVSPATPHCKPNPPVHPHSKPKSGLGLWYIRSDRPQSTRMLNLLLIQLLEQQN